MNDRLEIASRLMAALFDFTGTPKGHAEPTPPHMALMWADALIAEEARTRPPAADAPAPDDLRAVAEELNGVLDLMLKYATFEAGAPTAVKARSIAALARARAIGLGGGK